ncbi:hypothetical protein [Sphingomicrobium flavum]|uniref:hypothetical protein n=1 Tax=Sphingomicrobium flavum TaxID=1229164 RepID=UPI0021AD98D4|nr:hypothetical protein [Sphingomicrobium flavum]
MRPVSISIFGDFGAFGASGERIDFSNRRARALLAMLCLDPDATIEREQASTLLWPGRFPAQARASLRQCLLSLGKTLEPHVGKALRLTRHRIGIEPAAVCVDDRHIIAALDQHDWDAATERLAEVGAKPVLEGMAYGSAFQAWLDTRRDEIEKRLEAKIEDALAHLRETTDFVTAQRYETAWRRRWTQRSRHAAARVAIIPFKTYDQLDGDFFLADAVAEELGAALARRADVAVAGRTSVEAITKRGLTIPAMASELNVTHMIEGSAFRDPVEVRFHVRLIDGADGTERWSHEFEGTVEQLLGARQIIGETMMSGLCEALDIDPAPRPPRTMTRDREAYALYLQGREMTLRAVGDGVIARGIAMLERALEIDPDFAECWAALAEAHLYTGAFTASLERVELTAKMADAARRAATLDPNSGHARAMLAVHAFVSGRAREALDLGYEAYALEPANVDVVVRLSSLLLYVGLAAQALPLIETAIERDPVHGRTYIALCSAHLCLGNHDAAIAAGQRMADLGIPGLWLAVAQAAAGQHEDAVATYRALKVHLGTTIMRPPGVAPLDDTARDAYFELAANGVCSGDPDKRALYCQMIDGLHATMPDPYDPSIAFPAIWMGHAELVMKIYSEQTNVGNVFGLMTLWADSDMIARTRAHPDFLSFCQRRGFTQAWDRYGWPSVMEDARQKSLASSPAGNATRS